jgi:myo-inositol-1-phosphate synthase
MSEKLGVLVVGAGGAVASTVIGGVLLMKKGLVPKLGMLTETEVGQKLPLAAVEDLEFGGWDIRTTNLFEAAKHHGVIPRHLLPDIEEELSALHPWPSMVSPTFLGGDLGDNAVDGTSYRDQLRLMRAQVEAFRKERGVDRTVIVNLASTERHTQISDVHLTPEAFEAGLDANDPRISPAMRYLYLAITMDVPHVNFTPSLSNIPALDTLSQKRGVPIAGEDGKTGQTLLKTVLAPAFAVRQLLVQGWYSTNILGNNDGRVLDDPASNKTKVTSKLGVLDNILGYGVDDHQVHIHYYRPRGDAKEAWDNIDLLGFLGEPMQVKVNFLCKDSILAAPLVLDLARLIDVAHRVGECGVQRQFSVFFKAPYRVEGEPVVHDLFEQFRMLREWSDSVAAAPRQVDAVAARAV